MWIRLSLVYLCSLSSQESQLRRGLESTSLAFYYFFPLFKEFFFSFTGTFGRIFHGFLLDEKDPTKEKQVFVKTVKGMCQYVCKFLYL